MVIGDYQGLTRTKRVKGKMENGIGSNRGNGERWGTGVSITLRRILLLQYLLAQPDLDEIRVHSNLDGVLGRGLLLLPTE